ncbi:MAG: DNA repair protein [Clostridia bacterium]|nr:DNA repair protein [Clostridia bacterium]
MSQLELKKLSRKKLLELLLKQTERADRLEQKLHEANKQLEARQINIEKVGSIAEATVALNGVFASAQAAADQYLENIKQMQDSIEFELKRLQLTNQQTSTDFVRDIAENANGK